MAVETSDVEVILGRELTELEVVRAERLLVLAEALVGDAMPGFTISPDSEEVEVVDEAGDGLIWTPRYPVTDLVGITVRDGGAVDLQEVRWTDHGRITMGSSTSSWPPGTWPESWPPGKVTYDVEYSFGFDPTDYDSGVPGGIVAVVAGAVAAVIRRQATNPGNVLTEQTGPFAVTHGQLEQQAAAAGLAVDVSSIVKRWKRQVTSAAQRSR